METLYAVNYYHRDPYEEQVIFGPVFKDRAEAERLLQVLKDECDEEDEYVPFVQELTLYESVEDYLQNPSE